MWKALKLPKFSQKWNLKGPGTSYMPKSVSRDSHGQKYMRETLDLMWNNATPECFDLFSASIKKCFHSGGILGTNW